MHLCTMRVSASGAAAEQASGSNRCTTKKCCQLQRELGASYRPLIKLPKDQSLEKGVQVMRQASIGTCHPPVPPDAQGEAACCSIFLVDLHLGICPAECNIRGNLTT